MPISQDNEEDIKVSLFSALNSTNKPKTQKDGTKNDGTSKVTSKSSTKSSTTKTTKANNKKHTEEIESLSEIKKDNSQEDNSQESNKQNLNLKDEEPRTKSSNLRKELLENGRLNHPSINGNVLATILNPKVEWLEKMKKELPLESFKDTLKLSDRSFYSSLNAGKTRFILECKKASPSKGLIREDFSPKDIAKVYDNYAAAISVLTDEDFFQGDYKYLKEVHDNSHVPVLCKDFIFDPYQVYLARYYGADAILLMLSVLTDDAYIELSTIARKLNMGILTESSTEEEVKRALKLKAQVLGINNRNLRTLKVDLENVRTLSKLLPKGQVAISESGIYTHDQVLELSSYVKGFLVGSSLTGEPDIEKATRKLIFGENKVCGITRGKDAIYSYYAGANYNGLIFYPKSKRYVTLERAREIIDIARSANTKQEFVGVFVNDTIEKIVEYAYLLKLSVIQLHGNEDENFINKLKEKLPPYTKIWKAVGIKDKYPSKEIDNYLNLCDKVLLDSKNDTTFGGTGESFDWGKISHPKDRIILAGGLYPKNLKEALKIGTIGLDLNSGVEKEPGIKDKEKLDEAFSIIKDY